MGTSELFAGAAAVSCGLILVSCGAAPSESTGVVASAATTTLDVTRRAFAGFGDDDGEPEQGRGDGGFVELLDITTDTGATKERFMSVHFQRVDVDESSLFCPDPDEPDECRWTRFTEWRGEGPVTPKDAFFGEDGTASVHIAVSNTAPFVVERCVVNEGVRVCEPFSGRIDVDWSGGEPPTVSETKTEFTNPDGTVVRRTISSTIVNGDATGTLLGFAMTPLTRASVSESRIKTQTK